MVANQSTNATTPKSSPAKRSVAGKSIKWIWKLPASPARTSALPNAQRHRIFGITLVLKDRFGVFLEFFVATFFFRFFIAADLWFQFVAALYSASGSLQLSFALFKTRRRFLVQPSARTYPERPFKNLS
jgi:hypothetical protein